MSESQSKESEISASLKTLHAQILDDIRNELARDAHEDFVETDDFKNACHGILKEFGW